jgi:hypothetical protein
MCMQRPAGAAHLQTLLFDCLQCLGPWQQATCWQCMINFVAGRVWCLHLVAVCGLCCVVGPAFVATVSDVLLTPGLVGSWLQGLLKRKMHPSPWEMAQAPIPLQEDPRCLHRQGDHGWRLW